MDIALNTELLISLALLVLALISFVLEKIRMEVTALILLGLIIVLTASGLSNWPNLGEILGVFSSEAPLTIISMFMISSALTRHRIIERLSLYLEEFTAYGYKPFMLMLLLSVAICSAFVNNTPVVVILLPVAMSLSKTLGVSSSKLLIPISYASIFGGCCTLIGTSTNILASGFMTKSLHYPNMKAMEMFELSKIGLPLLFTGLFYLIFFGRRLLPEREALSSILAGIQRKEYLTEAIVLAESTLLGKKMTDSVFERSAGIRLLDVVRAGNSLSNMLDDHFFQVGDRLIMTCKPQALMNAREGIGVQIFNSMSIGIEGISMEEAVMKEGMVGPTSPLISKSLHEIEFRTRYNLSLVALHRRGKNLQMRLGDLRIKAGDSLLFLGSEKAIDKLRASKEVILLEHAPVAKDKENLKPLGVMFVLGAVVVSATFGILPLSIASILGVICLVTTRLVTLREASRVVEWNIIILIYSMLALGVVLEKTGASALLAEAVIAICQAPYVGEWQLLCAIAVIYLVTAILTEMLSNNATIAIMAPVSLAAAHQIGLDENSARAFVLTACIASSASFITPIGYQTNTFVYGVGGYRFKDFLKFGIWPMGFYFLGTTMLVSWHWNFIPL